MKLYIYAFLILVGIQNNDFNYDFFYVCILLYFAHLPLSFPARRSQNFS